jgi:hypothetical protein
MSTLVIAAYHCEVSGKRTNSLDYQVRHFASDSLDEVTTRLIAEPPVAYKNRYGQDVRWLFDDVVATELDPKFEDGAQVIGFITGRSKRGTEPAAAPNRRPVRQRKSRPRRRGRRSVS